jgi:capsular polysaccharide export protein
MAAAHEYLGIRPGEGMSMGTVHERQGRELSALRSVSPTARAPRCFLFLQGPTSRFLEDVARCLIAKGHRVQHINLNLGDRLFWRLPALDYRGRFTDWRDYLSTVMEAEQTTDLVFFGDRRPYHVIAAEVARARGIQVINLELGYLRPDWVTIEHDGMNTYSRFPRDAAAIRDLASQAPEPEAGTHGAPFGVLARLDVTYTLAELAGRIAYPLYRRHAIAHPAAEYASWIVTLLRQRLTRRKVRAEKAALCAMAKGSYFLFALQLATDFQIRSHSPYGDLREAVREVIDSFAAARLESQSLVIIVHPLDSGLIDWHRYVRRLARQSGAAERISIISGGTPAIVQRNTAGLVTVNSTLGLSALQNGVPVKVLGKAIFDIPGLASQQSLAAFWRHPLPPDAMLVDCFTRALAGTIQIKGSFYEPAVRQETAAALAGHIEEGLYPLQPLSLTELANRVRGPVKRRVVVIGGDDRLTIALARAHAAPRVALHVVMLQSREPALLVEDCLRRGAMTSLARPAEERDFLVEQITAVDRQSPIDVALLIASARGLKRFSGGLRPLDGTEPAADVTDLLASGMRRSGRGRLGLICLDDDHSSGNAEQTRHDLLAVAAKLRDGVKGTSVAVTTVLATYGDSTAGAVSADRAAELTMAAMASGKSAIELCLLRDEAVVPSHQVEPELGPTQIRA